MRFNKILKLCRESAKNPKLFSFFIITTVALGSLLMHVSAQLALSFVKFEAESGNISSGANAVSDSTASGGSYINFFEVLPPGPIGECGLVGEVFCENFEEGPVASQNRLRSGDFDSNKISASRLFGNQYDTGQSHINWVERAGIPSCRSGSVANPLPPDDTLICNPNSSIGTKYGLTATAAQNYGDNSYRINQPFDIAGRTGTLQLDASLHTYNALVGYTTITFSDEPIASPSIRDGNGNGISMKNGFFISFLCDGGGATMKKYTNYVESEVQNELNICNQPGMTTKVGNLNRVQIKVSQNKVEVYATDYSTNGTTFGTPKLIYRGNPGLTFTRGYVAFGGHNHASEKYCGSYSCAISASQNIVWDNIAFDGPAIAAPKNYQIADWGTQADGGMSLGYHIPLLSESAMTPFTFKSVQASGATSAKLSLSAWVNPSLNNPNTFKLHYRLNSGTWHELIVPAAIRSLISTNGSNRFNAIADIDKSELTSGDNTIRFAVENVNNDGYAPFIANIDLLVF